MIVVKPKILPCGHLVCSSCLQILQETKNKNCPICKQSWSHRDVSELIVCHSLILDRNERQRLQINCSVHNIDVIFWCCDCSQMICKKCIPVEHKNCSLKLLEDAEDDMTDHLRNVFQKVKTDLVIEEEQLEIEEQMNYRSIEDVKFLRNLFNQLMTKLEKRRYDLSTMKTRVSSKLDHSHESVSDVLENPEYSFLKRLSKLNETLQSLKGLRGNSVSRDPTEELLVEVMANYKVSSENRMMTVQF